MLAKKVLEGMDWEDIVEEDPAEADTGAAQGITTQGVAAVDQATPLRCSEELKCSKVAIQAMATSLSHVCHHVLVNQRLFQNFLVHSLFFFLSIIVNKGIKIHDYSLL